MQTMVAKTDRFVDVTLRILTGVLLLALIGALGLLLYRSLMPQPAEPPPVPVVEVAPKPAPAAPAVAAPAPKGEVLQVPGQVFKCFVNGRATFSDKPCPEGKAAK
jgi:hypothetical protein